jgi:hypothetical protein
MKMSQRIKNSVQVQEAKNKGGYAVNKETAQEIIENLPLKNLTKIVNYKIKTGKTLAEVMQDHKEGKIK